MDIWNRKSAIKPPTTTLIYTRDDLERICSKLNTNKLTSPERMLSAFSSVLNELLKQIQSTKEYFKFENHFLQAFLYHHASLRKEKFLQALKKVKRCLKRLNDVSIEIVLKDVTEMIPTNFVYIEKIRLPTPQCLYYALHRLVGSFHLLSRCVSSCLESSVYLKCKLRQGHFVARATVGLAIAGRIRSLCLDLSNCIASRYGEIYELFMGLIDVSEFEVLQELPKSLASLRPEGAAVLGTTQESAAPAKSNAERLDALKKNTQKSGSSEDRSSEFLVDMFLYGDLSEMSIVDPPTSFGVGTAEAEHVEEPNIAFRDRQKGAEDDDIGESVSYSDFSFFKSHPGQVIEANSLNTKRKNENENSVKLKKKKILKPELKLNNTEKRNKRDHQNGANFKKKIKKPSRKQCSNIEIENENSEFEKSTNLKKKKNKFKHKMERAKQCSNIIKSKKKL